MGDLPLPPGFLLGCASAAHQVEGGTSNDWTDWEAGTGHIRGGATAAIAIDHWRRWRQDLRDLAALGQTAHRFSVEWSRVEPREGVIDPGALAHYAEVASVCRKLGMEPVVTLLHFTLPRWLAARGGVVAADAPARFSRFAAVVATRLATDVEWWVTINEPNVQAAMGYLIGSWPPGRTSLVAAGRALRGLLRMHAAGAAAVRAACARRVGARGPLISVAHHVRGLLPRDPHSPLDRAAAVLPDLLLNRWWLRASRTGRMLPPLGTGEVVPGLGGSLDYLGLNYYCDDMVSFSLRHARELFAEQGPDPRRPHSTFGWAIDPHGLHRTLLEMWDEMRLPILVTENGVADSADELRPGYLVDHLGAIAAAVADGVDVRGYLHWTAVDNFEWAEGYEQCFGLFSVDRTTLERTPKPSADVFAAICRAGAIPAALQRASPTGGPDAG